MNMQEFYLINGEYNFISGVSFININQVCDMEVFGSHERNPKNWSRLNFTRKNFDDYFHLNFNVPNNFLHFKIVYSGDISLLDDSAKIELVIKAPQTKEEISFHVNNSKIVFVGCARNCLSKINESINTLLTLSKSFLDFKIIIFENDSIDGTAERLEELAKENIIELIQIKNLDEKFPLRTQRLSYARNQLLSKSLTLEYDYYCVADLDGVIGNNFSTESFYSNFKYLECWDAVFPINKGSYYDLWAFRHSSFWPWDYEREMNAAPPIFGDKNLLDFYVDRVQNLNFASLKGWLSVESAFGGMGLYKLEKFKYSSYFGLSEKNQICEHTVFHEKAKKFNAQLYINPEFLVNGISI